ncbi:MAG: acylphosphatase [Chloroflexi bacterium]|nr:acylphosphatase [Chloroflexota bacterium]
MAQARLHARISGYVQGVNFRWHTRRVAYGLGLVGRVRNLADGRVEVVAEGERADLDKLLAWLYHGPSLAEVRQVEDAWEPPTGEFTAFEVDYS